MIFKSISSVAHLHLSRLLPRRPIQVRPIRAVGSDGSEDLAAALCPKYVVSVEYEVKALAIEHARAHTVPKPWGIVDLRPWSNARPDGSAIGEIRYERPGSEAADTSLLLKLLFTSQPLSIQVHPDDAYAQSIGLQNGKTEAWYVLSATPEAKVALGLKRRLTPRHLPHPPDTDPIPNLLFCQPFRH